MSTARHRPRSFAATFLGAALIAACSKEKPLEPEKPIAPVAELKASATPAKKPSPAQPVAPKKQPKKKTDSEVLAAYWKGMNDGRKATLAKKYPDAYAAFDRALVAAPDDARAISERGYAKLLAKDHQGAIADLDKSVTLTKDKKLLGQIYYNYGLAAEAKGDVSAARAAFARSNEYNPTPAAKKKLAGASACTAIIDHQIPSTDSKTFPSWKAAYAAAKSDYAELDAWSSEETTLAPFCTGGWKKGASCVAVLGSTALAESRLYVPTPEGKVVAWELGTVGGRCGGAIEAKLVSDEGDVTHVHWKTMQGIPVMLVEKNGEFLDCGPTDVDCTSACGDDSVTFADFFITKDKGESMLFVSREAEGEKDPITLSIEMPTVTVKGKGCNEERPLAR